MPSTPSSRPGLLALAGLVLACALSAREHAPRPRAVDAFASLPLHFEPAGTPACPRFLARGPGYALSLTPTEGVLALSGTGDRGRGTGEGRPRTGDRRPEPPSILRLPSSVSRPPSPVIRMRLAGANPHPRLAGAGMLPGRVNYLIGRDPKRWRTNLRTYAKVRYTGVYPGIDQVYYGTQRQLEYDFIVHPGADPGRIRIVPGGAERVELDANGDLVLHVGGQEVRQHRPVVYQVVDGERRFVDGGYSLLAEGQGCVGVGVCGCELHRDADSGNRTEPDTQGLTPDAPRPNAERGTRNAERETPTRPSTRFAGTRHTPTQVCFTIGEYDRTRPLIIDPVLSYSTYLGGSGNDDGLAVAMDGTGAVYVAGATASTNFPAANPAQDGLGGQQDAFVVKLDPTGSHLVYATYLGGSGSEVAASAAVDGSGNVYLAGSTSSTDFPTAHPLQEDPAGGPFDAFIAKLDPTGAALSYSTYLGGTGSDLASGLAVDEAGNACAMGSTSSTDFPTEAAAQARFGGGQADAFVARLNPAGSALLFSTYLGGTGVEVTGSHGGVALDGSGSIYVTGTTFSGDFPTTTGAVDRDPGANRSLSEAFVTRFSPAGLAVYSTYLGGTAGETGRAIAVDAAGNACVTGDTASADFPTARPLQAARSGTEPDAFVAKLNPQGAQLVFSTYLGGSAADFGTGIGMDGGGAVYVTGGTFSTDFPRVRPLQPDQGSYDAFVCKLDAGGQALVYSTYLGGASQEAGAALAVDRSGSVVVTGTTLSADFPTASPVQALPAGGGDVFVARLGDGADTPAMPTALRASALCNASVLLTWTDNSDNEDAFEIERRPAAGTEPFRAVGAVARDILSFTDEGLAPGTAYAYRVRATNLDGASPYSNPVEVTTGATTAPNAPGSLSVSILSSTALKLDWTDNSTDETAFSVERSTDAGATFAALQTTPAGATTLTDGSLTPGMTYTYRVRAFNGACPSAYSETRSATTPVIAVGAPTNLVALVVTESQVRLVWRDNSTNETGFKVERKGPSFTQIAVVPAGSTPTASYRDSGLSPGAAYTYRVRATSAGGDSPYSNKNTVFMPTAPRGKLQVPRKVNFGRVALTRTGSRDLVIRNLSRTENLRVTLATPAAPFSFTAGSPGPLFITLASNRSVRLSFTPTRRGRASARLAIQSTDPRKPVVNVTLVGAGK